MAKRIYLLAGHYGSGKTNIAVNFAFTMKQEGKNAGVFVTENADVVLGANDREQLQALNDIAARNFPEAVK